MAVAPRMISISLTILTIAGVAGSSILQAREGGDVQIPGQACEGAVRSASMSLERAQDELNALGKRTATRAEYDKARAKVKSARARLKKVQAAC